MRTICDAARLPWAKLAVRARLPRRILLSPQGNPIGDGAGLAVRASLSEAAAVRLFEGAALLFEAVTEAAAKALRPTR